jgi:hypothetical protein
MRFLAFTLFTATVAHSGAPHRFVPGQPAKADSVNANFDYLSARIDSLVKVKIDSAFVVRLSASKADTSQLSKYALASALATKVDTGKLSNLLASKPNRAEVFIPSSHNTLNDTLIISSSGAPLLRLQNTTLTPTQLRFGSDSTSTSAGWYVGPAFGTSLSLGYYDPLNIYAPSSIGISKKGAITLSYPTSIGQTLWVGGALTTGDDVFVGGQLYSSTGTIEVGDYVFEPDYILMSLSEIEAYTKANKHLPEIPSALEIQSKGLNLTEMNLLLLKKIEELTLHAIDLEKRLNAQSKQIQGLIQAVR